MKEANLRAALEIAHESTKNRGINELDLHSLHVEEALVVLKNRLLDLTRPDVGNRVTQLRIITGYGSTNNGKSTIKPAVIKFLQKDGFTFSLENKGCILVAINR